METASKSVEKSGEWGVDGMTCTSCASSLESMLGHLHGVSSASVNYANRRVRVAYDPTETGEEAFVRTAADLGYHLITGSEESQEETLDKQDQLRLVSLRRKVITAIAFSIPVFVLSMFFPALFPGERWVLLVLSLPVLVYGGGEFYVNAWKRLLHGTTSMDTLVALSTGAAFIFSTFNTIFPSFLADRGMIPHVYYESAVIIITLILLGRWLEERARQGTSSAIRSLIRLRPAQVTVVRNGKEMTLSLKDVGNGDLCLLKTGNAVPVDGKLKRGELLVDESMLTGEAAPVARKRGDRLYAGTMILQGSGQVVARATGGQTLLAGIIRQVREAQASKPDIQHVVDRVASVFVPVVILLAVISSGIWWFAGPEPQLTHAFTILITVLIIACPCALGLATPTALMVGIGRAAENGILIRDANTLEVAHKIDTLILDKTGTLTRGKPEVREEWTDRDCRAVQRKRFASLEKSSAHPLSVAITNHLNINELYDVNEYRENAGKGITGIIQGQRYYAGTREWLQENNLSIPSELEKKLAGWTEKAYTVVLFGGEGHVIMALALADAVKPGAGEVIGRLKEAGITVRLLSGDTPSVTARVAAETGIDLYAGGLKPDDKGDRIAQLQQQGHRVAMAGDGINDAEALVRADVGIAMGSGTDVAMESAGMTLIGSDLALIPVAFALSHATIRTIRQNLFWAFIYNLIALPVAAGILYPVFLINPMTAGAAMALSSVSVVANSLRLKKTRL